MQSNNVIPVNFKFGLEDIRVIMIDDEPWFVAADICRAINIGNPTDAVKTLDDDDSTLDTIEGSHRPTNLINESGLYSLIFKSRKPEAKKFKKWVTSVVLPQIRKTGSYTYSGDNTTVNDVFTLLNKKDKKIEVLEAHAATHMQVNTAHSKHVATDTPFTVTSVADDFTRLHPKVRNAVVLNKWLISRGIIEKVGKTYQLLQANEDHFVDIGTLNLPQIKITYAGRKWLLDNEQAIRQFASEVSMLNYNDKAKNLEYWLKYHTLDTDDF